MTKDEALDLALEAAEWIAQQRTGGMIQRKATEAITAIKQARSAPVQEPDFIARLKHPEDHYEFTDPKKANAVLMSLCQEAADALAAPVQEPVGEVSGHDWSTGLLYRDLEPGTPLYTAPRATPAQMPATPEGWSLVAVKGFDDLMYWLDRCEEKGHLENCPDLIEPYQAFEYQPVTTPPNVTTPPAAQRQWVGLTDEEINACDPQEECWGLHEAVRRAEAKLKEKNNG
jgi:hypothetical protein